MPKVIIIAAIIALTLITFYALSGDNSKYTANNTTDNNTTNITLNNTNSTTANNTTSTSMQTKKTTTKKTSSQQKSDSDTVYFKDNPEASGEYEGVGEGVYKNKKTGNIYVQRGSNKLERDYSPPSYYQ